MAEARSYPTLAVFPPGAPDLGYSPPGGIPDFSFPYPKMAALLFGQNPWTQARFQRTPRFLWPLVFVANEKAAGRRLCLFLSRCFVCIASIYLASEVFIQLLLSIICTDRPPFPPNESSTA